MSRTKTLIGAVILFFGLLAAYSNHFQNGFHFDDWHTIGQNPYIRDIHNIPRFFTDTRMESTLPTHQMYRPIVSLTLAVDYYLGGLNPTWFHIDTFVWYIALLAAIYFLYLHLMQSARPDPRNSYAALFAAGLFALHPVSAETVNYIIQRAEVQSTLGVAASLAIYMWWPAGRKWLLYLVPAAVGTLAKQPALVFMPLLFVYVYLFESEQEAGTSEIAKRIRDTLRASLPAGAACVVLGLLQLAMTPPTFAPGAASRYDYWLTQPTVILHYIESFFLPIGLSADTDRSAVTSMLSETFVFNAALLILLVWVVQRPLRRREMRPAAFGIWWFVIAVLPTSVQPLAELDNDHRMFFPFVGLVLAATWMAYQALIPWLERRAAAVVLAGSVLLVACGIGTYNRNKVWHDDESLWKDVSEKSPHNGRGLMNYGLVLMGRGDYGGALALYKKAELYTPNYSVLKVNEGIVYGAVGDDADAEAHFRSAISLDPASTSSYYFFARWLNQKGRLPEAAALLQHAVELSTSDMGSRYLLMQVYAKQGAAAALHELASDTLVRFPGDPTAAAFLKGEGPSGQSGTAGLQPETAEEYLNLSLVYEQTGKHEECIAAARQALKLRPDYAEAYNNIAVAYEGLRRWDDAIAAAEQALRLKPDMQLARNNLQAALNQKKLHGS